MNTPLEQLTEFIFQTAMSDYDLRMRNETDPQARAALAFHRDTAEAVARDYARREAHKALFGSGTRVMH